jgi:polar amino acid transport system substrate-binding protein
MVTLNRKTNKLCGIDFYRFRTLKKHSALFILCLLIGKSLSTVHAEPFKVVIYTEEFPPLNYMHNKDGVKGYATEQVRTLMDAAGIDYDIQLTSWYRAYQLTLKTPNTLIYTLLRTPERENAFHWYCSIGLPRQISLFKLTDDKAIKLNQLKDAKPYILGVVRGDYPAEYLLSQGFRENKNLIFSTDEEANTRMLLSKRIDLIVQTEQAFYFRLAKLGFAKSKVTKVIQSIDGRSLKACLAINKDSDPKLITLLDNTFETIKPQLKKDLH